MRGVLCGLAFILGGAAVAAEPSFRVKLGSGSAPGGRLLVAIAPGKQTPRFTSADPPGQPVLGVDVAKFDADTVVTLDGSSLAFPRQDVLKTLPAGEYTVQAVFAFNRDLCLPDAPGNRHSKPTRLTLPAAGPLDLTLTETYAESVPADSATHKYLALPSKLLSEFHKRPMVYRVAVVLPADFAEQAAKRYPLAVHIGGFGQRYISARRMRPDPRFVQILLDGAGPFGDPYQVNSANNGPYGDALTQEVIPEIERRFRCVGTPQTRFLTGGSTGGWVSLALQVFYPDFFNGCWSQCPDGVDFRAFQLADITRDANMYVNRTGFERPARRTLDGDTVYTVRHECRLERVLGGTWQLSGQQWASWNAVYGPRGPDGKPVPLWDGETGAIDPAVAKQWAAYDLARRLESDWPTLQPKLAGKLHIWVGDADDYFLNNAVHRLKRTLGGLKPASDAVIEIMPRMPHTSGWDGKFVLDAMAKRAGDGK